MNSIKVSLFYFLSLGVSALPREQKRQDNALGKTDIFQWQIYSSCSDENRQMIEQGWKDSQRLGDALGSYKFKSDYQPAMDMYMGDRSTYSSIGDPGFDFPKQIADTTRRYRGLFDGKSEYGHSYLWVYCNEDSFWFKHCEESDTSAIIAYEQEDRYFNNWYITFCPAFYNSKWEVPLDDVTKKIKDNDLDPMVMENWALGPGSQAATWLHESFHLSQLVTSPQAVDKAYGPENVYNLARDRNTDAAVYNSDSWTMTALAIFAQKEFDLKDPPYPYNKPPSGVTAGAVSADGPTLKIKVVESDGNFVPEGATREPNKPWAVDRSKWDIMGPAPPVESPAPTSTPPSSNEPKPKCEGPNAFPQAAADAAIDSFCSDPRWTKQKIVPAVSTGTGATSSGQPKALGVTGTLPLDGTDLNLWTQVYFSEDTCIGSFNFDEGECKRWMKTILNGCDTDTITAKHGGSIMKVCAGYRMMAKPKSDTEEPWKLKGTDKALSGDFKCEDTDVSAIGGAASPLAGTCTCRYTGIPGVFDTFNKPQDKSCADATKQDVGSPMND